MSFKLSYYYFIINHVWNNIVFQIDENNIYEYILNMKKKNLPDPKRVSQWHYQKNVIIILLKRIKMLGIVI